MQAHNPWRLAAPTVGVDLARRIDDLRHEVTVLVLASLGHRELAGCLRAAGAAVEECARIAMRDVDRSGPTIKRPVVSKKKALGKSRRK